MKHGDHFKHNRTGQIYVLCRLSRSGVEGWVLLLKENFEKTRVKRSQYAYIAMGDTPEGAFQGNRDNFMIIEDQGLELSIPDNVLTHGDRFKFTPTGNIYILTNIRVADINFWALFCQYGDEIVKYGTSKNNLTPEGAFQGCRQYFTKI